ILSADDPYSRRLLEETKDKPEVVTFGFDESADFRAVDLELSARDSRFTLRWGDGESLRMVSPLIGRFNIQNVLAALATAFAAGITPSEAAGTLIDFEGVRGRMERVDE